MFIDQGLCTFRFLEAHNIMVFQVFFKHVKFTAKEAVVTTEKGTTIPGEDSKTVFLVAQRRTRKEGVKYTTLWHRLGQ